MEKYLKQTKPIPHSKITKPIHPSYKPTTTSAKPTKQGKPTREQIINIASIPSSKAHDMWQSHSTGHQVSDSRGPGAEYHHLRAQKLQLQFGNSLATKHLKADGSDVVEQMEVVEVEASISKQERQRQREEQRKREIFKGCVIYINANTTSSTPSPRTSAFSSPLTSSAGPGPGPDGYRKTSDLDLKRLITSRGGQIATSMARKQVTHVLLTSQTALAASKVRKELARGIGGAGGRIKYVTVDWVFACLRLEKRVNEATYGCVWGNGGQVGMAKFIGLGMCL